MLKRLTTHVTFANVTSVLALVFAMAGGAWAVTSIAGGNRVIHGCYQKNNGSLRIVPAGRRCKKSENAISWNQTGPRGLQGQQGLQGSKGDTGATGAPGPATGTAGGDLAGNYPNPTIAAGAVSASKLASGAAASNLGSAGGDLTGGYPNPTIAAGAVGPSKFGTIPAVRVANSATESISTNTVTALTFDTNSYDNSSMHSTTTHTSRLTAPVTGTYDVVGDVSWGLNGSGTRILEIVVNGSSTPAGIVEQSPVAGDVTSQSVSTQVRLNAGDYVELDVFQSSGGSLTVGDVIGTPNFAMHWAGP